jgi:hypothetical protein
MNAEQLEAIATRLEKVGERIAKALEHRNDLIAGIIEEREQDRRDDDWWKYGGQP